MNENIPQNNTLENNLEYTNIIDFDKIILNLEANLNNDTIINEEKKEDISWKNKEFNDYENILKLLDSIPTNLDNTKIEDIKEEKDEVNQIQNEITQINKKRKWKSITKKIGKSLNFFASYIFLSTVIFFLLLWSVNYSAYSKIAYSLINPQSLKNSSKEILTAIDNSKIKVYADEENKTLTKEQEKKIETTLKEENAQLRETYFSPKKLVPLKSDVSLDVEIVPYENRIIIPKIGKNIPLVDVDSRRWDVSFDNLENIFMTELEKWVLRYPGTAKPWENWVSFMFWHSSNFPWIKWDYNDVFALLDEVSYWDEIIIYYNQKKFVYTIKEKKVIKPWNVKILDRDPEKKEISLMTCWPIWTTLNRLIVFGELKEIK